MVLRAVAVLLGGAAALVAVEAGLRLWTPEVLVRRGLIGWNGSPLHPRHGRYALDPVLGYVPVLDGGVYAAAGTLVNEYALEKPSGVERLLFLGDSVTRRGFLVAALRERLGDAGREWWIAGVEGYNTEQEVGYFREHCASVAPDRVVLTFHLNDFAPTPVLFLDANEGLVVYASDGAHHADPVLLEHSFLYRLWLADTVVAADSLPGRAAERVEAGIAELRDLARVRGAGLTVLVLPMFLPREEWTPEVRARHAAVLASLARLGVDHHDLAPALDRALADGVDVQESPGDRHHPSLGWSRVAAEQLAGEGFPRR